MSNITPADINTLTSPDTSSPNSGKQVTINYTVSGIQVGESYTIKLYANGLYTNTNYTGTTNATFTQTYTDNSNTYIFSNANNTIKLLF